MSRTKQCIHRLMHYNNAKISKCKCRAGETSMLLKIIVVVALGTGGRRKRHERGFWGTGNVSLAGFWLYGDVQFVKI